MTIEEQIKQVAINEALKPSFALTKQFITVNKLQIVNDIPIIEDVHIDKDNAKVYFPVVGEDYYFVIYLDIGEEVTLRWMGMSAGNDVDLVVISEDRPVSELITILGILPSEQWQKGEPRIYKNTEITGPLNKNNGFQFRLSHKRTGEVEEKLKYLLEYLILFKESLIQLSKIATTVISIGYYGYKDEMWVFIWITNYWRHSQSFIYR